MSLNAAIAAVMVLGAYAQNVNGFDQNCCDPPCCDFDTSCCDSSGCNGFIDGLGLFSKSSIKLSGWVDAGFMGNTSSPGSKFNGPYNAVDRSNEAMLNQIYLIAEKELPNCGTGIGGRIDYLYGEDYVLAESIGMEKRQNGDPRWNNQYYGSAIPQAFVSLGSQSLSLQLGHFYSVVGYEGVMAPDNFFYSKSYSYQFAGPFTHWGAQMNWKPNQDWTVQAGLTNGWDALDRVSDKMGLVSKVRYDAQDTGRWTSFAIVTGDDFNDLGGVAPTQEFSNRTRYSWLVGLPLSCKLDYVFHHWLGVQENGAPDGGQADWYGIDQYLTYSVNKCTKIGMRGEWFRDEEGTRVGLNRTSNPNKAPFAGNFYSCSVGVNYTPTDYLMLRPELRGDWYDGSSPTRPYDDGADDSQFLLGFDVIVRL